MKTRNSFSDAEHLALVARRIKESGMDLTADYGKWIEVAMACASVGEEGREPFQDICSNYLGYKREECDAKFDNCLRTGRGQVTLATLMQMAKEAGVDVSLPRGRRRMSGEEKEKEGVSNMTLLRTALGALGEWRYNVWRARPEVREPGTDWRPVEERDLNTFYCREKENGLKFTQQDLTSLIYSRDFCHDYDAVKEWLSGLGKWNPETDPDYLKEFYQDHLVLDTDGESAAFIFAMLVKWHVGMVALMLGVSNENPLMPILCGVQHVGKTYFARHILPPALASYQIEVNPQQPIDKDFLMTISETILTIMDEITFEGKRDALKHIITSTRTNLRDAYARFRESRERRSSLIATTNEESFISGSQGNRRYLVLKLKKTVSLDEHPLPYEGAFAQAMYLLESGFQFKPTQEESQRISELNSRYRVLDDCEEALLTILKRPGDEGELVALTAGEIKLKLGLSGFRGQGFDANTIGKTMTQMGYESKTRGGRTKYLVVVRDLSQLHNEGKREAQALLSSERKPDDTQ